MRNPRHASRPLGPDNEKGNQADQVGFGLEQAESGELVVGVVWEQGAGQAVEQGVE